MIVAAIFATMCTGTTDLQLFLRIRGTYMLFALRVLVLFPVHCYRVNSEIKRHKVEWKRSKRLYLVAHACGRFHVAP